MKKIFIFVLTVSLIKMSSIHTDVLVDLSKAGKQLFGNAPEGSQIFTNVVDEKKQLAASLNDKRVTVQAALQEFNQKGKVRLDELANQIARIKVELKQEPENYQFLDKKLAILNEQFQELSDISQSLEHSLSIITDHIKIIQEYLQDSELTGYLPEYQEGHRPYSFEDLQALNELMFEQERTIAYLTEQERNAIVEFENRKRSTQGTSEIYKKRQAALNKLAQEAIAGQVETEDFFGFDIQQKGELLRLETQLYHYKKQLDELRLQEIEYKISFIKTKIFISKLRLDKLRNVFRHIKPLVKVREAEVLAAKAEFAKKKQSSFLIKEGYRQEIERITADKERRIRILDTLSKRYNVVLEQNLDEWAIEPRETIASYVGVCEVGALNEQILLLDLRRKQFEAQIALEDEKIDNEGLAIDVKESYYKITSRQYSSAEDIRKGIKEYDTERAKLNAERSLERDKQHGAVDHLNQKRRAAENIKGLREKVQKQRTLIFNAYPKEYARCFAALADAEARINQEIDIISKVTSFYADSMSIAETSIKQIDFIIGELEAITIWYRPEYAISWHGIKNIIPDISRFWQEMYTYISQFSLSWMVLAIERGITQPMVLVYTVFKILCIALFILLIWFLLPHIQKFLLSLQVEHSSLELFRLALLVVVEYIQRYFIALSLWVACSLAISWDIVSDPYLHILFYLISIPYLLYLGHRALEFVVAFNIRHNYGLVSHDYLHRFIVLMSILLYSTIIITYFRNALMLGIYHKSELPAILLALNFIIFQICLIFLITKEQVLSLIPRRGSFWLWLHETVDRYYYPILILLVAIIVMSNPYVGFGRLVLFALRGIVYTIILIRLLFFVYELVRRLFSQLFFSTEEEVVRERFVYAKSWYGLFVIGAFIVVATIGLFICARIWGWLISLHEVYEWLETPLIYLGQEVKPITIFSILHILFFCLAGLALSIVVNRFALRRIFDLLLVDSGVQNTIASFTRYLIVIAAIMLGFQSVGLGSLVIYLTGALILSIGWVIKDPISDLMSYFIILMQRPVKIGDYIWIDSNIVGVVRKITPRSVIIRRKNSNTVVVPNTQLLTKPVINWNYVQGFLAFDDIMLTVGYKEDPEKIKNILFQVLDKHAYILKSPKPIIRLENFTEAGFEFLVRGFLSSNYTLDQWDIASDVRIALVKELRKQGIEISVPMRIMITSKPPVPPDELL
jgi:small-conductance mechanosensitive channel